MANYTKKTPRINIKFVDGDTEEILFELNDRNWMTIGELFTTGIASSLVTTELKNKKLPKNLLVMAVSEFTLEK